MIDLNEKLTGVQITLPAVVTPEGEESKEFELVLKFDKCTVLDVIYLSARPRRITWANSHRYAKKVTLDKLPFTNVIDVMPIGERGEGAEPDPAVLVKKAGKLSKEKLAELIMQAQALLDAKE